MDNCFPDGPMDAKCLSRFDRAIDQHGQYGTDRIDDDAFPFGHRTNTPDGADLTQQRTDDRWARNDQNGAKQNGFTNRKT